MTSTAFAHSEKGSHTSTGRFSTSYAEVASQPRQPLRRPTKQASYELCNHAKAYLEGGQIASGYDFLCRLLAASTSISTPAQPHVGFLAPPAYLAFAASLIAYPKHTTQTHSREAIKGANAALNYLRCVHITVDEPAYSSIRTAFTFPEDRSRRRGPTRRSAAASLSPEPTDDIDVIVGDAANSESVWARAEDFWHIVGWAFNCSVVQRKRWHRWKLWLTIMLDFLETDWGFAFKRAESDDGEREQILKATLIWRYTAGNGDVNRVARRRIVGAVLASATTESLRDYPEIWKKENLGPKMKKPNDLPLGKVDFEAGDTGDYDSDEEMQDLVDSPNCSARTPKKEANSSAAATILGGLDAIELRQRLLALLAKVAVALPNPFTTLGDFFDNILEDFIHLPSMVFEIMLSTSKMPESFQVAFNANLLEPLVSIKIPDYIRSPPVQHQLESTLLPIKATTQSFAVNAKVSLILEQILIYMMNQEQLVISDSLRKAVEAGIKVRHSVSGTGRGKKGNPVEEEQAKTIMHACSDRMRGLLGL